MISDASKSAFGMLLTVCFNALWEECLWLPNHNDSRQAMPPNLLCNLRRNEGVATRSVADMDLFLAEGKIAAGVLLGRLSSGFGLDKDEVNTVALKLVEGAIDSKHRAYLNELEDLLEGRSLA